MRAYTGAAQAALEQAHRVTVQPCVDLRILLPYPLYEQAARLAAAAGAKVRNTLFTDKVTLELTLLDGSQQQLLHSLRELCRGKLEAEESDPYYAPF